MKISFGMKIQLQRKTSYKIHTEIINKLDLIRDLARIRGDMHPCRYGYDNRDLDMIIHSKEIELFRLFGWI